MDLIYEGGSASKNGGLSLARMHSRRKGRASSVRPLVSKNPDWVTMKQEEIISLIIKMKKEGEPESKIGLILRDQYGIPSVKLATGKHISQIIKDAGIKFVFPEDLHNLIKKASVIDTHLKNNPKDLHNLRRKDLIEAKIRRLVRYYKSRGIIREDWHYSLSSAMLMME